MKETTTMNDNPMAILRRKILDILHFAAKMTLLLCVLAFFAFCYGCAGVPEGGMPDGAYDFITNSVQRAVSAAERAAEEYSRRDDGAGQTEDPATISTGEHEEHGEGAQASSDSPASPSSPVLLFRYGGFDGSKAVEDQATWIEAFRFTSTGMSYQWASSSLRPWGLEDTEAGALACAFYWSDKEQKWIGGKFDWISTSRTSRSWENIRGRYNGWDPDAFFSAKRHAFCIVSRDGKRRTNLLTD